MKERPILFPRERPILFTPANAGKIFSGQKTQTRRVVRLKCGQNQELICCGYPGHAAFAEDADCCVKCPYGIVGDRLWIREAFKRDPHNDCIIFYRDGSMAECRRGTHQDEKYVYDKWRSAMFMPRWACRTVVEITEIRVERVQGISEEDSVAEGVTATPYSEQDIADIQISDCSPEVKELAKALGPGQFTAKGNFMMLWDSINGEEEAKSWRGNPWVWAISFRRVVNG